jgi:hypothetical protein
MKQHTLGELFTQGEIDTAAELYDMYQNTGRLNGALCEQVIRSALPRINRVTGQQNDARYLGYALEHLFNEIRAIEIQEGGN